MRRSRHSPPDLHQAGHKIIAKIAFADASDGAEQPVYILRMGCSNVSIPQLKEVKTKGGIAVIDPRKGALVRSCRSTIASRPGWRSGGRQSGDRLQRQRQGRHAADHHDPEGQVRQGGQERRDIGGPTKLV